MGNQLLDVLDWLRKERWSTVDGLIGYSVAIVVTVIISSGILKYLGVGNALRSMGIPVNVWWILGSIPLLLLLHYLIWLTNRKGFYTSEKILMVFAIKAGKEQDQFVREMRKNITRQLALNGLSEIIDVSQLAPDVQFATKKDAEDYISKDKVNLMIWGDTTEATNAGSKVTIFHFNISYLFSPLVGDKKANLENDIGNAIQRDPWGIIDHMNSLTGIQLASQNIFEMSLFALGACLVTTPNVIYHLKAVTIFEKLKEQLKQRRGDPNFQQAKFMLRQVNFLLTTIYVGLSYYYVFEEGNYEKGIDYAEDALLIEQNNFGAHLNLANYYWKTNQEKLSRQHAKAADKIQPTSDLVRLNRAFFHFYDRRFASGLKLYKKLKDFGNVNTLAICEFVEDEYEKHPDNHSLLFAFSWLSIQFGDEGRGKEGMKKFLSVVGDDSQYEDLTLEAKTILSE